MSIGKIVRERREELNLTLDEVAASTGFSKPYLSTVETGRVKNPPSDELLRKLEVCLKFTDGQLLHLAHMERMPSDIRRDFESIDAQNRKFKQLLKRITEHKLDTAQIGNLLKEFDLQAEAQRQEIVAGQLVPVINRVVAGYPAEFDDMGYPVGIAEDYVRCPDLHDPNAFAVRIIGDSMEPKFSEGDIVVFSPAADVQNGDDCFVRFTQPHECTFKRIFFEPDGKIRLQPRNETYAPTIVDGIRLNGMYRAVIRFHHL
ncbi:MAG: helix-turn-helix domain-containing protein [Sedimentisphaerales bacterium]|nr:helix-turn-helix domain-containing protein [Sedimentisphaerales bacterium]